MKKKHRDITVEGVKYAWTVNSDNHYYHNVKIWLDKKVIYEVKVDDDVITPKMVKDIINSYKWKIEIKDETETKSKKLVWLDDFRNPFDLDRNWLKMYAPEWLHNLGDVVWLKTYNEFVEYIEKHGLPARIAFDHDLADEHYAPTEVYEEEAYNEWEESQDFKEKTGMDAAKWLVDYCMDNNIDLPMWVVQSANPNGAKNINDYLLSYLMLKTR